MKEIHLLLVRYPTEDSLKFHTLTHEGEKKFLYFPHILKSKRRGAYPLRPGVFLEVFFSEKNSIIPQEWKVFFSPWEVFPGDIEIEEKVAYYLRAVYRFLRREAKFPEIYHFLFTTFQDRAKIENSLGDFSLLFLKCMGILPSLEECSFCKEKIKSGEIILGEGLICPSCKPRFLHIYQRSKKIPYPLPPQDGQWIYQEVFSFLNDFFS